MIELAQTEPGIAARPDAFDCDPWLLNVTNGTLDLRTGKLRAHDRGDLLTKLAPVTYDPDATHPTLDRYLSDATGGDADFSTYLQRAAGYSLTGSTAEECFFLMLGPAATGKSTLLEAMLALLGDYGVKAAFEAFLEQRGVVTERATPERARLRGARLVAASETSKSRQLNEALVKQFTAPFTFFPTFKLWLAANEAPKLTDTDTGLWRRLQRLPFEHAVPEGKRDPKVKQAMTGEALPALLAWAVRGCLAWQAGGLRMAPAVRAATVQLRAEFDPLVEFFAECCVFEHHAETPARELREAYVSWASSMGARPINNAEWSARLTAKGCQSIRTRRGGAQMTCWQGVGLLSDDDPAGATVEGVQYVHK
jgi:putative DNA primase/helicase